MPDRRAQMHLATDEQGVGRREWTIDADVSAIGGLVDRIMTFVRALRCAVGKENDVDSALRGALVNAVVHGSNWGIGRAVPFPPQMRLPERRGSRHGSSIDSNRTNQFSLERP